LPGGWRPAAPASSPIQFQRTLAGGVARISLDDFYRDRSKLPLARRAAINFDHPRAIDWPLVERALLDCRAGRPVRVPQYDFVTHTRLPGYKPWTPKPLILVDGLWLLHHPALRGLFDLRIFLECPAQLRLKRRLARDQSQRGRSPASIRRQFLKTVAPMHQRYVAPQARWADIILRQPSDEKEICGLIETVRSLLTSPGARTFLSAAALVRFPTRTQLNNIAIFSSPSQIAQSGERAFLELWDSPDNSNRSPRPCYRREYARADALELNLI